MLYLKTDTHWNNCAAFYAYDLISSSLGCEKEPLSADYVIRNDWQGDLAKMLYPCAVPECEQYYFEHDYDNVRFIKPRSPSMGKEEIMDILMGDSETMDTVIQTRNSGKNGSVYISRDSFFRSMLPFAVESFGSTYITRYRSFDLRNIADEGYTDVVYEIVQRKLDTITDTMPMICAAESSEENTTELPPSDVVISESEKNSSGWYVCGVIKNLKAIKDDSNICLTVTTPGGKKQYEAFPITDTEKTGEAEKSAYGFCALLPENEISEISVSIK